MRTQERSYRRIDETSFPEDKILKMGARIESILFEKNTTTENKRLLEYLKAYLLFRKNISTDEEKFYLSSLEQAKNRLFRIKKEDLNALNLWARGSRKNKDQIFTNDQLESLYDRVEEKLENLK
jgi:hypothetical protein